MKEIMQVVTEKIEFACRDRTKLKAHFGTIGLSEFRSKEQKINLLKSNLVH